MSIALGFALAALLVAIAVTDARTMTIPNALVGGIALLATAAALAGVPVDVTPADRAVGALAASVPLLVIALATGGFGGGDVKLMAAVGALLGSDRALAALFLGVLIGAVQALYLLVRHRATRFTAFPFGPALAIGAFCVYCAAVPLSIAL